jgi:undecaprenyl diphosphate synthase
MKPCSMSKFKEIPRHVAIIMDGNGRWAEKRGLSRQAGHQQGAKTIQDILLYISELGIAYVTLYAFSSENWQRPRAEIDAVMDILLHYLTQDINELIKNDVRIAAIGDLDQLPVPVKSALRAVLEKTLGCKKLTVTLALSYGSWDEMVSVCRKIVTANRERNILPESIDRDVVRHSLFTKEFPDPDLVIRTGGELRLSNFLLLQISYSELYFCKTLWPDFQRADFDRALYSFQQRLRRFGRATI